MQTDKVGTLKPDNYQVIFQPVVGYTKVNYTDYAEGVGTLKANGGDLGGGSETLIVEKTSKYSIIKQPSEQSPREITKE